MKALDSGTVTAPPPSLGLFPAALKGVVAISDQWGERGAHHFQVWLGSSAPCQ